MGVFGTNRYQLRVPWTRDESVDKDHTNENFRLLEEWGRTIVATRVVPAGAILFWGNTVAPDGWLLCDGALYNRKAYADLFGVCGTTFGTTAGDNFRVPDLRGRFPLGTGSGAGLTARTLGTTGGVESVTLTAGQSGLPSHNHTQDSHNHTQNSHNHTQNSHQHALGAHQNVAPFGFLQAGGDYDFGGLAFTSSVTPTNIATTATNQATTATNQAAGGTGASSAVALMNPFLVLTGIIKI